MVRQGLRLLLERQGGFEVVGESGDGLEVPGLVERARADVLVLDLTLPGLGGLDVLRTVRRRCPQTHVIVLSMHSGEAFVVEALRGGASAYVLKGSDAGELVRAIHDATRGRRHLSPPLSEKSIEAYEAKVRNAGIDPYEKLTAREREVVHLSAEGLTGPAIGRRLGISRRTVETHRANAMRKLGLRTRADLVRFAMSRRPVPPDGFPGSK